MEYNIDTNAYIFTKNQHKQLEFKKIQHDFLGSEINNGDKLIYIVDKYHAEFIFTNEKYSISCFYNQSKSDEYISSKTKIAFITNCEFDPNEWYDIYKLGFFSNVYSIELPRINHIIRSYDDIVMDTWGLKRKLDEEFINAVDDIYDIMSDCSVEFARLIVCYDPSFIRKAPHHKLPFEDMKKLKICKAKIDIYEDYSSPPPELPPAKLQRAIMSHNSDISDEFVVVNH